MIKISLTNDGYVLVDDDCGYLRNWSWNSDKCGYARRKVKDPNGKWMTLLMHREIMGNPNGKQVDHIDGNPRNNQRSNLRICKHGDNMKNVKRNSRNASGYKGVYRHINTTSRVWVSEITSDGVRTFLGMFETPEAAARAYDEKAKELHGKFARLNFPE